MWLTRPIRVSSLVSSLVQAGFAPPVLNGADRIRPLGFGRNENEQRSSAAQSVARKDFKTEWSSDIHPRALALTEPTHPRQHLVRLL